MDPRSRTIAHIILGLLSASLFIASIVSLLKSGEVDSKTLVAAVVTLSYVLYDLLIHHQQRSQPDGPQKGKEGQASFPTLPCAMPAVTNSIISAVREQRDGAPIVEVTVAAFSLANLGNVIESSLTEAIMTCGPLTGRVKLHVYHTDPHVLATMECVQSNVCKANTYFSTLAFGFQQARTSLDQFCKQNNIEIKFSSYYTGGGESYAIKIGQRTLFWGFLKWCKCNHPASHGRFLATRCFQIHRDDPTFNDYCDWIDSRLIAYEGLRSHPGCFRFLSMEQAGADLIANHPDVEYIYIVAYVGTHEMRLLEDLCDLVTVPHGHLDSTTAPGLKRVTLCLRNPDSEWSFPTGETQESRKRQLRANLFRLDHSDKYQRLKDCLTVTHYEGDPSFRAIVAWGSTPESQVAYFGVYPIVDLEFGPDFSAPQNGGLVKMTAATAVGRDFITCFRKRFDHNYDEPMLEFGM